MAINILRFTGPLVALSLVLGASARAEDDSDDLDSRLEVKHVSPSGNVSVETGLTPRPALKLVPFPEDEEESSSAAVTSPPESPPAQKKVASPKPAAPKAQPPKQASRPVKLPPTKTGFQPKFKSPGVRQAQHVEPTSKDAKDEAAASGPDLGMPMTDAPADAAKPSTAQNGSPGRPLIADAFAKSKEASTDSDYTDIIELCRKAKQAGLRKSYDEYAHRLMGWAYNRRGELRAKAKQDKEALADFEIAVELNPTSWRAAHNRAVSYGAQGRVKESLADFNRAIKLNPKYPNAYYNRAEMLSSQSNFEGAIRDYSTALELGGPDTTILNSRGHAFYRMKQFEDALADYSEAVELDPKNAAALINRGDTFCDIGKYAEAAKDYRSAVEINPKLGRAYQSAAWLMATCPDDHYRNDKLAVGAARKAIEIDGESYRNLEILAAAQANAGTFSEAKETQEKAIAQAPQPLLVSAERRMALYQRDLAFRERPQQMLEDQAEVQNEAPPVQRAAANIPENPPQRSANGPRRLPKSPNPNPPRY